MTGLNGTIYAPSALLSLTGSAQLQQGMVVGMLSVSGPISLTQIAAGSDGTGDVAGIANTLLAGDLNVYINDPSGLLIADELARIQDAITTWDAILAPYNVTITVVTDPTQANIVIDTSSTSACGGMVNGVLGCFNAPNSEITMIQGWNWYAGADSTQIGAAQYDFETTMLHELGHALGLGGSTNPTSPMYEVLAAGVADRTVTVADLNIPDPPAWADPQMAADFNGVPAAVSFGRNEFSSTSAVASSFITISVTPLMSAQPGMSTQSAVGSGQSAAVSAWVSPQAGVQSALVMQGADRGNERALKPWIGQETVDLFSLLEGTQRSPGPAVDPSAESERPVQASGVYRGAEPFAASNIVPSQLAVDSVLDEVVAESRALSKARGIMSGGECLGNETVLWEREAETSGVAIQARYHTGLQPAPIILIDMPTVPLPSSRRGAVDSPSQPTDLLIEAGLFGIGASILTAKTLSARRMHGKGRLFGLRRKSSR
jgi:hypothetical protein